MLGSELPQHHQSFDWPNSKLKGERTVVGGGTKGYCSSKQHCERRAAREPEGRFSADKLTEAMAGGLGGFLLGLTD